MDIKQKERRAVEKEVKQEYPFYPRLYNLYAKEIIKCQIFRYINSEVNREKIHNISYANDRVLITQTPNQLEMVITKF